MRAGQEIPVVSFLASGGGRMFSYLASRIQIGRIHARCGAVITDRKGAGVLGLAKQLGIRGYYNDPRTSRSREEYDREMVKILDRHNTELIVAAGYLRILSGSFVRRYPNRIINIHPSLLPSFPGKKSQVQALEYGVKITGCTAHFIDEGMDTGPIILQTPVSISENETIESLSSRILHEEYKVLEEAVRLFCDDRITVQGRRVHISR
jgi:phosphoribosylglycinamide formyltransferase-1